MMRMAKPEIKVICEVSVIVPFSSSHNNRHGRFCEKPLKEQGGYQPACSYAITDY